jgi:hypothetical protein
MEILEQRPCCFIAVAKGDAGVLSVVCGTSALFETRLRMPRQQLIDLLADEVQLQRLLAQVRLSPGRYF